MIMGYTSRSLRAVNGVCDKYLVTMINSVALLQLFWMQKKVYDGEDPHISLDKVSKH